MIPLIGLYEAGISLLQPSGVVRTGVDAWFHQCLDRVVQVPSWAPSACIVALLVIWQLYERREWWFPISYGAGMLLESLVLGVGLVGLGRLVDLGCSRLEGNAILAGGTAPSALVDYGPMTIGFLGAGIFEETIFRLVMIPAVFKLLRLCQTPELLAATFSVTFSALLFAVAHHVGDPTNQFEWFVFIFRWSAGIYFAWVFILRGFGIAVGTHVVYDVLIGCVGWTW